MAAKAESRYAKVNRRQIDEQYSKADQARMKRSVEGLFGEYQRQVDSQKDLIEAQARESARLAAELERAKNAYIRRTAERDFEKEARINAEKSVEHYKSMLLSSMRQCEQIEFSWRKLSMIVRIALTPERYHMIREEVENDFPEFIREQK